MNGFFEEVKRRKVYRVAAAYVIAAGGIIQLALGAASGNCAFAGRFSYCVNSRLGV